MVGTFFCHRLDSSLGADLKVLAVKCNITSKADVERVLRKFTPTRIYYLAAQSSVRRSWRDVTSTFQVNLFGAIQFFETLLKLKSKAKVLVISSGTVYGKSFYHSGPLSESACLNPLDPYSLSKAAVDVLARLYAAIHGLRIVVVRLTNVTGPGQSTLFSVPNFAKQLVQLKKRPTRGRLNAGNLKAKRDYLDVRDSVRALHLAMEKGKAGEAYNISSGTTRTLDSILHRMIRLSNMSKPPMIWRKEELIPKDEIPVMRLSSLKFRRLTGWEPRVNFQKTLVDTLEWFRN